MPACRTCASTEVELKCCATTKPKVPGATCLNLVSQSDAIATGDSQLRPAQHGTLMLLCTNLQVASTYILPNAEWQQARQLCITVNNGTSFRTALVAHPSQYHDSHT
eukprot:3214590-Amphidinium_carterae.2